MIFLSSTSPLRENWSSENAIKSRSAETAKSPTAAYFPVRFTAEIFSEAFSIGLKPFP